MFTSLQYNQTLLGVCFRNNKISTKSSDLLLEFCMKSSLLYLDLSGNFMGIYLSTFKIEKTLLNEIDRVLYNRRSLKKWQTLPKCVQQTFENWKVDVRPHITSSFMKNIVYIQAKTYLYCQKPNINRNQRGAICNRLIVRKYNHCR